jgi:hypothetical protein
MRWKLCLLFLLLPFFCFSEELFLGFYSFVKKEYIDKVSGTYLNNLMPYGTDGNEREVIKDFLDYAELKGVNIIFSVKDCYKQSKWYPKVKWTSTEKPEDIVNAIAENFSGHKAICGWYISDEPMWHVGLGNKEQIKKNCEIIRKYSDKPIIVCDVPYSTMWDDLSKWCDILAPDIYPVPGGKVIKVYQEIKKIKEKYKNKVYGVLQVHGAYQYSKEYDEITGRAPTYEEIKVMSYLSLLAGADGILYYSIFDLLKQPDGDKKFEFLKDLAVELRENYKIIKGDISKLKIEVKKADDILYILRRYKGDDYIIFVNLSGMPNTFSFNFEGRENEYKLTPYEVKIVNLKRR